MTPKERVYASLNHEQPDKTPYNIQFTQMAHARMVEYYGDPEFTSKIGNAINVVNTSPAGGWKDLGGNVWEDQFGVRWDRSVDKDIGVVCNQLVGPGNVEEFVVPDPDDSSRYDYYEASFSRHPDLFALANLGFSLYERAWTLAGMENLLMAMVSDKPFAHRLLDRILDFNLRIIDNACEFPIDAMMFGDDWGQQGGLIMGPELWREFIKPRIRRMYSAVKANGKKVFIHSCGKVDSIFPDLIECGLDSFNPFQPEVIDVFEAKAKYGEALSFYGGISTQRTLPFGTVDEVRREVRQLIERVGENGGYIAAPAHAIPADAKPENIAAMIDVLQSQ